jgi:putative spermidine/putrescine transport system substrate-binding protein
MMRPTRRTLLAAASFLPLSGGRAAASDLTLVLAGESARLSELVSDDLSRHEALSLPVGTLRHETVPWIVGELQEEVEAGLPSLDVVMTNFAGFALGALRELWQPFPASLLEAYAPLLTPAGRLVQARLHGHGLVVGTVPGGPVLMHRRSVLPVAPRSAAALLDYARENPGRFQYARPGQSRFGQAFVIGMPHLLKEAAPLDPEHGWGRTWPYLRELGRFTAYYPASGRAASEEFVEGGVDLAPALLGSYLLGMATGLLPADTLCTAFDEAPLVPHSMILAVPRGVPASRIGSLGPLAAFLHEARTQRLMFGRGLLPGNPASHGADVVATEHDRLWTEALTPELDALLAGRDTAPQLDLAAYAYMLRAWDERIGSHYGEAR